MRPLTTIAVSSRRNRDTLHFEGKNLLKPGSHRTHLQIATWLLPRNRPKALEPDLKLNPRKTKRINTESEPSA